MTLSIFFLCLFAVRIFVCKFFVHVFAHFKTEFSYQVLELIVYYGYRSFIWHMICKYCVDCPFILNSVFQSKICNLFPFCFLKFLPLRDSYWPLFCTFLFPDIIFFFYFELFAEFHCFIFWVSLILTCIIFLCLYLILN